MFKAKSIAVIMAIILFASAFCSVTPATPVTYNVYYGSLHNHTNVSDGTGTPSQAYAYARDIAGLDFFGIADHAESISSTEWTTIKNTANSYNQDGTFVAFHGFEWSHSTYGHVAVINTTDYCKSSSAAWRN